MTHHEIHRITRVSTVLTLKCGEDFLCIFKGGPAGRHAGHSCQPFAPLVASSRSASRHRDARLLPNTPKPRPSARCGRSGLLTNADDGPPGESVGMPSTRRRRSRQTGSLRRAGSPTLHPGDASGGRATRPGPGGSGMPKPGGYPSHTGRQPDRACPGKVVQTWGAPPCPGRRGPAGRGLRDGMPAQVSDPLA